MRLWVAHERADRTKGKTGLTSEERAELSRLRKENRQLRMERDILKNNQFRVDHLLDQKLSVGYPGLPEWSGRQLTGDLRARKKHGPGVVADLTLVTPIGDPV